jgi:alkanesulfonate monooxygenase SsuD/methylene tetrahydromethanopterin reductase-like flavin-dependent oxidoreductase (luciferase family)
LHEEDRRSLVRALDALVAITDPLGRGHAAAIHRTRRRGRRAGSGRGYFGVHEFARQLASSLPLLAAVGANTSRIEIGTAVIDMRYENPLYMAEDAGAADLIAGGRLQLGISRGSPT